MQKLSFVNDIKSGLRDLSVLLKMAGFQRKILVYASILSFFASIFRLIELRMTFALMRGIVSSDLSPDQLRIPAVIRSNIEPYLSSFQAVFIVLASVLIMAVVMNAVINYISLSIVEQNISILESRLRSQLFKKFLWNGKAFFDEHSPQRLQHILISSTKQVMRQLNTFHELISVTFLIGIYLSLMVFISWKLTLITVPTFVLLTIVNTRVLSQTKKLAKKDDNAKRRLDRKIYHTLTCIPLVKAYANEEREQSYFRKISKRESRAVFRATKTKSLAEQVQSITTMVAMILIAIAISYAHKHDTASSATKFLFFFIVARMSAGSFGRLSNLIENFIAGTVHIESITEMLGGMGPFKIANGTKKFEGLQSSIEFRNLSFRYKKGIPVVDSMSFSIEKGKKTAIIGASGSGKSTLVHLLMRFYEVPKGMIFIDGVDIREYDYQSVRKNIALVSQDTHLFNDTLKYNISYGMAEEDEEGQEDVSDELVLDVADKAHLGEFVLSLPEQLETLVGERGVKLSGGEKQRTSIARAFLKNADIVILDEASSNLDVRTEHYVHKAINEMSSSKTLIVIAHRLSTVKHVDNIIVLDEGRVVEQGTFDELIENEGLFYEYWQLQRLDDVVKETRKTVETR